MSDKIQTKSLKIKPLTPPVDTETGLLTVDATDANRLKYNDGTGTKTVILSGDPFVPGFTDAASVSYDNTSSGLPSTDVQGAIDDLNEQDDQLGNLIAGTAMDLAQTQADLDLLEAAAITSLTGGVTATGPGAAAATVVSVGGKTSTEVASAVTDVQNATFSAVLGRIVKRDSGGAASFSQITLSADPTTALQAATKQYVDALVQGLNPKQSVRVATTANITLSGLQTIDGIAVAAGNRVLVKNQTTSSQNGIYIAGTGAWTRSTDADTWPEVVALYVFVQQGTVNADSGYLSTADDGGTLGTTAIPFVQFTSAGAITTDGQGLLITGTQLSLVLDGTTLTKSASGLRVSDNVTLPGSGSVKIPSGTTAQRSGTPAVGMLRYNTDLNTFEGFINGLWGPIGGASGGGLKNYLSANGNLELGTTSGFSLFSTTMTGVNPTGTISAGAASFTTFAASNTTPLAGTYSLSAGGSAALTAGQGFITDAVTIDLEDRGRPLSFTFFDRIVSGLANLNLTGTTANTFAVWFYDVTNSQWVQPTSSYGIMGDGKVVGTVSFPTTTTSIRMAILVANASAGAATLSFDDFAVGPQVITMGPVITAWQPYTPTIAGFGTPTGVDFSWRRVGENIEVSGYFVSGTTTATQVQIGLPAGLVTAAVGATYRTAGTLDTQTASANLTRYSLIYTQGVPYLNIGYAQNSVTGDTILVPQNGNQTPGVNSKVSILASVRIAGYSGTNVLSSDASTGPVVFNAGKTSSQGITADVTNIQYTSVTKDTGGGWNGTDTYTVRVPGNYLVTVGLNSTAATDLYAWVNGVSNKHIVSSTTSGNGFNGSALLTDLVVGQTIQIRGSNSNTINAGVNINFLQIQRMDSGSQQIAASEVVSGFTSRSTNQTITNNTSTTMLYNATKDSDTHNAYDNTTGVLTCPRAGYLTVDAMVKWTGNATGIRSIELTRVSDSRIIKQINYTPANSGALPFPITVVDFPVKQGDQFRILVTQLSGGSLDTVGGSSQNTLSWSIK